MSEAMIIVAASAGSAFNALKNGPKTLSINTVR